jgi:hypothetical protein
MLERLQGYYVFNFGMKISVLNSGQVVISFLCVCLALPSIYTPGTLIGSPLIAGSSWPYVYAASWDTIQDTFVVPRTLGLCNNVTWIEVLELRLCML